MADGVWRAEDGIAVAVETRVHEVHSLLEPIKGPKAPHAADGTVVVGEDWHTLPAVRMLDRHGNAVVGKHADLMVSPASAGSGVYEDVGIAFEALASNADGWVFFSYARVAFAVREGVFTFQVHPPVCTSFLRQGPYAPEGLVRDFRGHVPLMFRDCLPADLHFLLSFMQLCNPPPPSA